MALSCIRRTLLSQLIDCFAQSNGDDDFAFPVFYSPAIFYLETKNDRVSLYFLSDIFDWNFALCFLLVAGSFGNAVHKC